MPLQNVFPDILLASPYPGNESVALETVDAQLVDERGEPVPLSEVRAPAETESKRAALARA